jgi:hypothetical protein
VFCKRVLFFAALEIHPHDGLIATMPPGLAEQAAGGRLQ